MSVNTDAFVDEMESLWTGRFSNKSNDKFRQVWRIMAETYQRAIIAHMRHKPLTIGNEWFAVAPEMGVGKTTGAHLYLGMMGRSARDLPAPFRFGAIMACRTINQSEEAVAAINDHAGYTAAITRHSVNNIPTEQVSQHPILVITHAALLGTGQKDADAVLQQYSSWADGKRMLTIIDEALSNAVNFHTVTEKDLLVLMSLVPGELKQKHELAWFIITSLYDHLRQKVAVTSQFHAMWDRITGSAELDRMPELFNALFADMKGQAPSLAQPGWNNRDVTEAHLLAANTKSLRS